MIDDDHDPNVSLIDFAISAAALAIISTAVGATVAFGLWYGVLPMFR